ncbi:similar to Saccharomyces cerevisiae YGL198W YIP4 Protein that interacts with Rab GTPases, localized to late Golgi vesicles [Maudiozyma barnettii]|uniref:Similar to Saccharomyces cerevisiae YGL198W YIP4 Protein that interacts with Rab GTPases, localized to late Golgi vesicles n=1 Tax=Maudiozyma barnettii TaxID=61262 RepID=A0A8H2VBW7_9SACH|nr:Yip4p [Kazachstania barnettii]CAB4252413.1 similar to Saccharomyces cerevisiae YGL198W YIP4 Protein that interacts with Rab GTPases, localized to late Golgi vesicles [Kazachstania barnettii]CAD1779148.1 similar to Saccharomyces cerevisiae YGL198W YIP4 Protein that interacts with Rab GTPases, localized to late Golgi vesicles [Kazachstania barnettii]
MSDYIEPDTPGGVNHHSNLNNNDNLSNVDISNPFDDNNNIASAVPADSDNVSKNTRGTLDENVLETLRRDLFEINSTLKKVVYPHFPSRQLLSSTSTMVNESLSSSSPTSPNNQSIEDISANCDLWAPLIFVITYSLCVSHAHTLFSSLFVLCWILLLIMSLHMRLTKPYENVNMITYISLSGYCIFPQVINAIISQIIFPILLKMIGNRHWSIRIITLLKLITLILCELWSLTSISLVTNSRGLIQIFPLGLCLLGLGWLATIL